MAHEFGVHFSKSACTAEKSPALLPDPGQGSWWTSVAAVDTDAFVVVLDTRHVTVRARLAVIEIFSAPAATTTA